MGATTSITSRERPHGGMLHADARPVCWYKRCSGRGRRNTLRLVPTGETLMKFAVSRILVPVDFSAHSELALRYATALAGRLGAVVEIFHVVEDPIVTTAWSAEVTVPDLPALREGLMAEAERQLDRYRTIPEASHVQAVTTVRMGQRAGRTCADCRRMVALRAIVCPVPRLGVSTLRHRRGALPFFPPAPPSSWLRSGAAPPRRRPRSPAPAVQPWSDR